MTLVEGGRSATEPSTAIYWIPSIHVGFFKHLARAEATAADQRVGWGALALQSVWQPNPKSLDRLIRLYGSISAS